MAQYFKIGVPSAILGAILGSKLTKVAFENQVPKFIRIPSGGEERILNMRHLVHMTVKRNENNSDVKQTTSNNNYINFSAPTSEINPFLEKFR